MRIDDMPRPWLLAAMTGLPMSALVKKAEEEKAERSEEAHPVPLPDQLAGTRARRRPRRRGVRIHVLRPTLPF